MAKVKRTETLKHPDHSRDDIDQRMAITVIATNVVYETAKTIEPAGPLNVDNINITSRISLRHSTLRPDSESP